MNSILALNGIMGVGKSTIGKKLAEQINYYFIDLDSEIEDRFGCSINEIFSKKGEEYFREIEYKLLNEIITRNEKIVIALGGGTYIYEKSRILLQNNASTIWLNSDLDEIFNRLKNKNNRPLLNFGNKKKILQDLIAKRNPIYQESNYMINIFKKKSDQLVNEIINLLSKNDGKN